MAREDGISEYESARVALLMLLGGRCERCGFNDMRALQIDHIDGGGALDVRVNGNGATELRRKIASVILGEGLYQCLCANCNWIKRSERGENSSAFRHTVESSVRVRVPVRVPTRRPARVSRPIQPSYIPKEYDPHGW